MKWRVKYWKGEWVRTGLMTLKSAEEVAATLRELRYEQVEVYYDDDNNGTNRIFL